MVAGPTRFYSLYGALLGMLCTPALADLVSHAGTMGSVPACPGFVIVDISSSDSTGEAYAALIGWQERIIHESTPHQAAYRYDSGKPAPTWENPAVNGSMPYTLGGVWPSVAPNPAQPTSVRGVAPVRLSGASFDHSDLAWSNDSLGSVLPSSSSWMRQSEVSSLWMGPGMGVQQDDGLPVGFLTTGDGAEFREYEEPDITPIPAPGAVVLGALGLGLVGWTRRRLGR